MNKLDSEPIYIALEDIEKILQGCCFKDLLITPVLQIWDDIAIGNYKATGYLIVAGICQRDFLVASYISEGIIQEKVDCEKAKFLELINLSFIEPLVEKGVIDKNVVVKDVIVK